MLRIGEFSQLAQVPVATLRYYDQLGLLKPAQVDKFTEYRYYTVEQLPRLNRILALKDLGFSLEQIERMLDEDISAQELRGMYLLRQADTEREMTETQQRLARVAYRLREIEEEGKLPQYDIVTKSIAPQWIISTRQNVAHAYEMAQLCWTLHGELRLWGQEHGLTPLAAPAPRLLNLYYNTEYTETDLELEAAVLIAPPKKVTFQTNDAPLPLTIRELEGVPLIASGLHRGPMDDLGNLIKAMLVWVSTNQYEIIGPVREVHHTERDAETRVVEMQAPIRVTEKAVF